MQITKMTEIIYDYFTSRIKFGYFKKGERLPSIPNIRKQFGVSALTVRTVLKQMKEEGYIETTERTPATVIFQPDEQSEQQYIEYFLSHRDGMDDICRSSDIIFGPIIQLYFQKQDKASLKRMQSKLRKASSHTVKPIIMFYADAIQSLNNSLILNLHWEMARYLSIPYLRPPLNFEDSNAQAMDHIRQILQLLVTNQAGQAARETELFNEGVIYQFLKRLESLYTPGEPIGQIPFHWHIYREHPQLCYTIAAEIMSKVDRQVYEQGEFLPSCKALSIEYGVSFITARRTVSLLNEMCITESLNGIGARIISESSSASPDLQHPQIQRALSLFLQSLHLGSLTCKNAAIHTLSSLESFQSLEHEIQSLINTEKTYFTGGTCLRFIGDNSPSPFIKEVYKQVYHLLLWGYSLHRFYKTPENINYYEASSIKLLENLQNRDIEAFADLLSELLSSGLNTTRDILIQLGINEKELI